VRDLVALAVPAVVLATQRAWAITEAAYARGFDSPHRRPYRQLSLRPLDWLLLLAAAGLVVVSLYWR
jgi:energy-coupling factor transporter transmembrane protein EcfT